MKIRDFLDVVKGRFRLPTTNPGASIVPGEQFQLADVTNLPQVWVRNLAGTITRRFLTNGEYNIPGGIPQLDANGKIPTTFLPVAAAEEIGMVREWAGYLDAIPANYLVCDGAEYLITAYPTLFSKIGYMWGQPSITGYFRVPPAIGRTSLGGYVSTPSVLSPAQLHKVVLVAGGSGYTNGTTTVALTGGTGTPATVSITVVAGAVTDVSIVSCGSYTAAPITLSPPGVGSGFEFKLVWVPVTPSTANAWRVRITAQGSGYAQATTSIQLTGFNQAVPVIVGGKLVDIVITKYGIGPPGGITIVGAGVGAAAVVEQLPQVCAAGDTGGTPQHQLVTAELAAHTHGFAGSAQAFDGGENNSYNSSGISGGIVTSTGGDVPHNNMPPFIVFTKIIKAL